MINNVNKNLVGLNGYTIDLTNFNCTHFYYQKKNTFGGKKYEMLHYDPTSLTNTFEFDYGSYISMSTVTTEKLNSDYDFIPKDEFNNFYVEYLSFLRKVTASKNILKSIYKKLILSRHLNIRTIFTIQRINVTRITLINYYMSLSKQIFDESSHYGNIEINKFVDFDVNTETEEVDNKLSNFVLESANKMVENIKQVTSKNEELIEM